MRKSFRRLFGLLCVLLWMLSAPMALSHAESDTGVDSDSVVRSTFSADVPDALRAPLTQAGFDPQAVQCGAMLTSLPSANNIDETALLAAMQGGTQTLVALWRDDGHWSAADLGEKMLLPGRAFRITLRNRMFLVEYAVQSGITERYGFEQSMSEKELWQVCLYEREDASGTGYAISMQYGDDGFWVSPLGATHEEGARYPAYWLSWCHYMDSLLDYPTTEADAQQLAARTMQRFSGTDLVLLYGSVNLREAPTGASKSLGRYDSGTLAHKLGEEPGRDAPWIHVRIGDVEGYVSGVYVRTPTDPFFSETLFHMPLTLARTTAAVPLRQAPAQSSEAATRLPAGSVAHIMGRLDGGWLHIMLPREAPGWDMDVDGQSGYVHESEVVQGNVVTLGE